MYFKSTKNALRYMQFFKVENLLEASAVCVSQLITSCACHEEPIFGVTLAVVTRSY